MPQKGDRGRRGPWSSGAGSGSDPDFEDFVRQGQDRLKRIMPGGRPPGVIVRAVLVPARRAADSR